jgi:hypothetical protein
MNPAANLAIGIGVAVATVLVLLAARRAGLATGLSHGHH